MLCRSDLTLVCSPLELSLLHSLYCIPSHKLCNAPFFTEAHLEPQHESARTHFMTIGNWKHPPNRDGVQWLCQSIWPAIRRQLPHAELHIYGAHMSGAAQQYHTPVSLLISCTDLPHKWSEFALPHSRPADSQPTLARLGCLHPHHAQSLCNVQAHYQQASPVFYVPSSCCMVASHTHPSDVVCIVQLCCNSLLCMAMPVQHLLALVTVWSDKPPHQS